MTKFTKCGCVEINNNYTETKIEESDIIDLKVKLIEINEDEILKLKNKIICEFYKIISQLLCGILPDLELILEEISLISILYEDE